MKMFQYMLSAKSLTLATLSLLGATMLTFASGCGGDSASGNGDLGMINYSLYSTFYMTSESIREVKIVAGHPQSISLTLTEAGSAAMKEDDVLASRFASATGVTVEGDGYGADVTVTNPGQYELQTLRNNQLFDKITLQFEKPAGIELLTWVRTPSSADFVQVDTSQLTTVPEGTQAIFLPVPLGPDGQRLAGYLPTERTVDPDWAIVEGENVTNVTENVISSGSSPSIYFIEEGTVNVDFFDSLSGANATHSFQITPVQKS